MNKYVDHTASLRHSCNARARQLGNPPPYPADEIPGGIDTIFQKQLDNMIYYMNELYDWDRATAIRALTNLVDDLALLDK